MSEPYNVVRIGGTLPGGEVWSVNPKFATPDGGAVSDYAFLQAWANSIVGLNSGRVLPTNMNAILSSVGAVTSVRTEYYGEAGTLEVAAEAILSTPAPGTATASKTFSDALCVSLITGRPGRSYRGRLYFPALAISLAAGTLRIAPATTQTYATEVAGWLDALGDAAGAGSTLRPTVVSQTKGITTQVTSVRVGDVLDTQRRRRDALTELYSSANVPT